ncbi:TPA: helix-turn-helix domain-containing protein [Escherichia coli]|nr:helix-turn-helix domain-containing protein [Escherichia coli]
MDSGSASGRINHYEKGRHAPDIDTLQRLAEELNVPLIFFARTIVSAELACLISVMDEEQRKELLKKLKIAQKKNKHNKIRKRQTVLITLPVISYLCKS